MNENDITISWKDSNGRRYNLHGRGSINFNVVNVQEAIMSFGSNTPVAYVSPPPRASVEVVFEDHILNITPPAVIHEDPF